jgi:hypothetical protein
MFDCLCCISTESSEIELESVLPARMSYESDTSLVSLFSETPQSRSDWSAVSPRGETCADSGSTEDSDLLSEEWSGREAPCFMPETMSASALYF